MALLVDLLVLLLADGSAEVVGVAELVAGQRLDDLHHLLLIDDHAVRVGQDRLEGFTAPVDPSLPPAHRPGMPIDMDHWFFGPIGLENKIAFLWLEVALDKSLLIHPRHGIARAQCG